MRVNPILTWSGAEVWSFLRTLELRYCPLYDQGYTSLGSRSNTFKNKNLAYKNENGEICYRPAYSLDDEQTERHGRTQNNV
ncbi:FAD1 flavin adenine dinucleotide synthetase [Cichlidogyrus casuarinus]|uniref:FAD synthase n=1 Tax=Cichlidogyrus casuarinus TaxID=1844966 RepID=A0ABD2PYI8_9PLAT